jgi:hypothetical protein
LILKSTSLFSTASIKLTREGYVLYSYSNSRDSLTSSHEEILSPENSPPSSTIKGGVSVIPITSFLFVIGAVKESDVSCAIPISEKKKILIRNTAIIDFMLLVLVNSQNKNFFSAEANEKATLPDLPWQPPSNDRLKQNYVLQ